MKHLDEVYSCLVKLHELTNKNNEGCIFKDIEKNNTFVFIEKWESKEALDKHSKKEHFVEFVSFVEGKLEDMSVNLIEELKL